MLVGVYCDGGLLGYSFPVFDEDPGLLEIVCVPPLCGLDKLSDMNGMFASRNELTICILEVESENWPVGIRALAMR